MELKMIGGVLVIIALAHVIRKYFVTKARAGSYVIDRYDRKWYYMSRQSCGLHNFRNPEWHIQSLSQEKVNSLFPDYKFK